MRTNPSFRYLTGAAALAMLTAACAQPFDYETASAEQRQEWLETSARGVADGLDRSLPRGSNGIHARLGATRVDPEAKSIDVVVDVTQGGDRMSVGTVQRDEIMAQVCRSYSGTDMERNGITVRVRYMLPGGGTALSLTMSPENCARHSGG